jgi:hypothetical protein
VLIDAPSGQIPELANVLASYGIHASFALDQASSPVETTVLRYGDQALPRLPTGGLVRWMGARGQLRTLMASMGYRNHFLYESSGPSVGQWLVAHGAGGRLVAGAVRLNDSDDSLGQLRPGEVIEVSVSSSAQMTHVLSKLLYGLEIRHLSAVQVGRLMRDAGTSV